MRSAPLYRVARSMDGQRFEVLSDADTRALFDELGRRWDLVDESRSPAVMAGWCPQPADTPARLVDEVVRRAEAGETVAIALTEDQTLFLRCARGTDAFRVPPTDDPMDLGKAGYFRRHA